MPDRDQRTRKYKIRPASDANANGKAIYSIVYEEGGRTWTERGNDGRVLYFQSYSDARKHRDTLRPRHKADPRGDARGDA